MRRRRVEAPTEEFCKYFARVEHKLECKFNPEWQGKFDYELGQEKTRNDYAFEHQFNEKPSMISGCPAA